MSATPLQNGTPISTTRVRQKLAAEALLSWLPLPALILPHHGQPRLNHQALQVENDPSSVLAQVARRIKAGRRMVRALGRWFVVWVKPLPRKSHLVLYEEITSGSMPLFEQLEQSTLRSEAFEVAVAGLAHDIRTPLNIVMGLAQMLESDLSRMGHESAVRRTALIREEGHQMSRLIEEMIDVVRLSHGGLTPRRVKGDLVQHVHAHCRLMDPLFSGKNILLNLPDPSEQLIFRYDHMMFERIMQNLLANAVRYTPEGGQVHVEIKAIDGGVQITVSDTGCGIDANQAMDIFDLLRSDGSSSGLGLYLVRSMAEAHGGSAMALPSNQGAHFCITLRD